MPDDWFNKPTEQSKVKSTIVVKYFDAWANVMIGAAKKRHGIHEYTNSRLAYVDLLSGPGYYQDGTKSTPIRILEKAAEKDGTREMLVAIFNDIELDYTQKLTKAIESDPLIGKLAHRPEIYTNQVDNRIIQLLEKIKGVPTFLFFDPWGYKTLSLGLISTAIQDWGSDCIFFFNYNRVNMALSNPVFREQMLSLFGEMKFRELSRNLDTLSPAERESKILDEIKNVLNGKGIKYVLPFRFKNEKNKTSHHLIFSSKHPKGLEIMKTVMAIESSYVIHGVPSLEFTPNKDHQITFDELTVVDELADELLLTFSGQTLKMRQIYEIHSIGKSFTAKTYKEALIKLESEGRIETQRTSRQKQTVKGEPTFGDEVIVVFPLRGD
jgi:three-Cys-motif partner protein